ncbi:MAG: hypothetical protein KME55_34770 [Nostoc indistinguendum CM1-VF10]|jgi:hypothetical protein|nr:hypothetical protein [Nostoc indistinguendum CM1-VF10]
MINKKRIYLSQGCALNTTNKRIVVNVSSEEILNLITQSIKSYYSQGIQQEIFETSLDFIADSSPSEISQLRENVAIPKPDTLVVVCCQIGKVEVNELELNFPVVVYFVIADTKYTNHFLAMRIQLSADIWSGLERFMDLEDKLGDQFFKSYEIQLIFDDKSQSSVELEVLQTLNMPARLQFLPKFKKFDPTVNFPTWPII